jgi:hypothetical protein
MDHIGKYGLFAAVGSAIIIPIVFFSILGNNGGNILLPFSNSDDVKDRSQLVEDDTFLLSKDRHY